MSKVIDRTPPRRPMAVSQTDLAQRAGVNRSTISRLFVGPLSAALLPGKRCDATHPAVIAWAKQRRLDPTVLLGEFHAQMLRSASASASATEVVPEEHRMSRLEFAARAEVMSNELQRALANELRPALLRDGRVHANSIVALEFMAAHPFRCEDGKTVEPQIDGADFLASASTSDPAYPGALMVNGEHVVARIWVARLAGIINPVSQ